MPRPSEAQLLKDDLQSLLAVQSKSADRVVEQLELLRTSQAQSQLQIIQLLEKVAQAMPSVTCQEAAELASQKVEANAASPKLLAETIATAQAGDKDKSQSEAHKTQPKAVQHEKRVPTDDQVVGLAEPGMRDTIDPYSEELKALPQVTPDNFAGGAMPLARRNSTMDLKPLHVEHHGMFSGMLKWGVGYSGKRKLLQYDFNKLHAFGALPAAFAECSIFRLRTSLMVQILLQPVLILAVYGITRLGLGAGGDAEELRERLSSIIDITEDLKALVAFLLGLFIALQLKRWWSIRGSFLQRIFFSTAQLSWFLGVVIPPEAEVIRQQLERYFLMSHRIIYHCARREHHLLPILEGEGLLTKHELGHLQEKLANLPEGARKPIGLADMDLAELPLMWTAQVLFRLFTVFKRPEFKERGLEISPPTMLKMVNLCMDVRSGIQDIEMILTSPVPFPYVHLVCLLVQTYTVFVCLRAGILLGTESGTTSAIAFMSQILVVVIVNSIYLSLLCLATVLDNPFTDEVIDFPAANLQSRLWKSQIFARAVLFRDADIDGHLVDLIFNGSEDFRPVRVAGGDEHDDDEDGGGD
eukprot:TRINITY_DN7443_c0_g3_i1.p1 TRINITY_DN7443_c0_g3~~TRINITY_DN7443_c0_g3_i1.p1  ORF type:complete len:584 (+),score=93.72 TRINITY_DN7443_c0_g3_i1:59-1810(+)